jgi:SAM-dependent methyltransferase
VWRVSRRLRRVSRAGGRLTDEPDGATRLAFVGERRRTAEERYDDIHAPSYDEHWHEISPSHERFMNKLLELTRPGGLMLDAPCGTGKYWPMVLESGRTLVGIDQSAGMLRMAASKFPAVPIGKTGLQDLSFEAAFDAVMCVDGMENIAPEDWPRVTLRLAAAARVGAPLYLTVELIADDELRPVYESALAAGHPVVEGEYFDGVGYHYYPSRNAVRGWLDEAGLEIVEQADGDFYWHLLLRRRDA